MQKESQQAKQGNKYLGCLGIQDWEGKYKGEKEHYQHHVYQMCVLPIDR